MADELPQVQQTPEPRSIQHRIREISHPVVFLITIVLVLIVVLGLVIIVLLLSGYPALYAVTEIRGPADATGACIGAATARVCTLAGHAVAGPDLVPIAGLSSGQRGVLASVLLLHTTCVLMWFLQLRQLFGLYCRGIIFAAENAQRINRFAFWLMAITASSNMCGVVFAVTLNREFVVGTEWVNSLVEAGMIYVIGYVMELGRAADLERKQFI